MLMGIQRSGTNALLKALSADRRFSVFNEKMDSAVFKGWRLRPEEEIRGALAECPGPVLLKPISETNYRPVISLVEEFKDYDVNIVWIFRDPVNVLNSQLEKWPSKKQEEDGVPHFVKTWNRRTESMFVALLERKDDVITVVRYEDLIRSKEVFDRLCSQLDIRGKYSFREDSMGGRKNLPEETQREVDEGTREVLEMLEKYTMRVPGTRAAAQRVS